MPAGIQALWSDVAFKWLLLSPALDCSTSCWQTDQNSVPRFPLLSAATPKQSQLFIYNLLWKSPSSLLWWIIELFDLDRVQRAASLALRPEVEEAGEAWAEEGELPFQDSGDLKALLLSSAAVANSRGHISSFQSAQQNAAVTEEKKRPASASRDKAQIVEV